MQYKLECPTLRYSTHQLVQPLLYLLMFEWFSGSHRDEPEWLGGLRRLGGFLSSVASQLTATHWRREGREGGKEEGRRREGGKVWVSSDWAPGWLHLSSTYTDHPPSPWPCSNWWSSCSSIAPPSRLHLLRDGEGWEGGKLWEHYYGDGCIKGKFPPCIYRSLYISHWLNSKQLWGLDLRRPHNTLLLHHYNSHIITVTHCHLLRHSNCNKNVSISHLICVTNF